MIARSHSSGEPATRALAMSYLVVFFIVGLLIFLHEIGHWVAARLLGIPVARFSVGIGRSLWSFRRGETEYRVSMIPFGGYVLPVQSSYFEQSPGARLLFALGGPAANLVVTFLVLAAFNVLFYGPSIEAVLFAPVRQTASAVALVTRAVPALLLGATSAMGPLGVVSEGGEFIGSSVLLALQFAAVMSVNLAVINLVPIPPLDGGRIVLALLEMMSARVARLQVPLNVAGFLALLAFLSWVTVLDVRRLITRLLT
jgi:regulator of sigma E protease